MAVTNRLGGDIPAAFRRPLAIAQFSAALLLSLALNVGCSGGEGGSLSSSEPIDFTLTDLNGESWSYQDNPSRQLRLVYFGYTLCPDACPLTMSRVRRLFDLIGERRASQIDVVFITVDPERDTPEKLRQYLGYFSGLDAIGLTGSKEEIDAAAEPFGNVVYEKVPVRSEVGYLIDHSTLLYLLDGDGRIRYTFRHEDNPDFMAALIRLLLP